MSDNNYPADITSEVPASAHLVHSAMRFGRTLVLRKHILLAVLIATCLLGAVYYFTAPRIFRATATLLVLQTGPDVLSTSISPDGHRQGMLPTYERLFKSAVVLEGALKRLVNMPPLLRVDLASQPKDQWITILSENLSAKSVRRTNLIEISFRSKNPQAADAVVNAVVDSYLDFIERNHKNVAAEIVTILDKERLQIEDRLMGKERELLASKSRLRDLGFRDGAKFVHPLVQRVVRINEGLVTVQQHRLQLESSLRAIQSSAANGGDVRQHLLSLQPVIGREVILSSLGMNAQDAELLNQLSQQLIESEATLDSLLPYYGRRHPRVLEIQATIQKTNDYLRQHEASLTEQLANSNNAQLENMLLSMVRSQLEEAWSHEQQLQRQYDIAEADAVQLNGRVAEVTILEHDLNLLRGLHDTLLSRIANIDINQNQADVRVAVVSDPKAEEKAISPRRAVVAFACLFLGMSGGALLVYVTDVLDDRFRSPEELKDQLGVPILTMIRQLPEIESQKGLESLYTFSAPNDVKSESFRTLRTALAFSAESLECVAISSAEPGDGKTTVLANLGVANAQAGKRTLLVDADLRRPGLTKLFDLRGRTGLSEVLRSDEPLSLACESSILPTGCPGLSVLPCGLRPSDPTGLLGDVRFSEFVAWVEAQYDQVLIDTPPILAASDAAIIGRLAHGLVLVVQPKKNHRRLVVRAVEELRGIDLNLIGIVVNRLASMAQGYYDTGYGYGYGYGYGEEELDESDQVAQVQRDDDFVKQHKFQTPMEPRRAA